MATLEVGEKSFPGPRRSVPGTLSFHPLPARKKLLPVLIALFAAALLVHTGWAVSRAGWTMFTDQFALVNDETEYEGLARQIRQGTYNQTEMNQGRRALPEAGRPTGFRTPGYPVMLAGIYSLVGESTGRARVVMLLVTSLLPPLLYVLSLILLGRPAISLAMATLSVFLPCSVKNAGWLLPEDITTVVLMCAVLLTIWSTRWSERKALASVVIAGLLVGLAILSRGFLLFVPAGLAAWLLVVKKRQLAIALFVASTILPTTWIIRNTVSLGLFSLSTETPEVIWLGHNQWSRGSWPGNWQEQRLHLLKKYPNFDSLHEADQARVFKREARTEVLENPGRVMWLLPRKFALFFSPRSYLGIDWPLLLSLPFFVIGALALWRDRERRHILVLAGGPVLAVLVINLMAYSDVRHRHPIEPLILVVAGAGLAHAFGRLKQRREVRLSEAPAGPASGSA